LVASCSQFGQPTGTFDRSTQILEVPVYDPADSFGLMHTSTVNMQNSILDATASFTLLHVTDRGNELQVRYR
jgi:hypothetical protein